MEHTKVIDGAMAMIDASKQKQHKYSIFFMLTSQERTFSFSRLFGVTELEFILGKLCAVQFIESKSGKACSV